jgi:UDP-glucuronate 4-epimerase
MFLLTGAAGFIGYHVALRLLDQGVEVLGVDTLNTYYDPELKKARLQRLNDRRGFVFIQCDIADHEALTRAVTGANITHIIHLAAQAGVRYSLEAPFAYEHSNVAGHLSVLELARRSDSLEHLVYASSSSVYGDRSDGPFRETDRCDSPRSLYAATKRACELMSEAYSHLHAIKQTGLRFFTVYGPWGRPDMAYWRFTENILKGSPIKLYEGGALERDFTFIDDVAPIVVKIAQTNPQDMHTIYNIGNSMPTTVSHLVDVLESAAGKPALREYAPAPKTEVASTFADHANATAQFGFAPRTTIDQGAPEFVRWYREFYRV